MDLLLIALTIGVPLIRFVLFPARTMARGGGWRIAGAVMIVGLMMGLWAGVRAFSDATSEWTTAGAVAASAPGLQPATIDLDTLVHLF